MLNPSFTELRDESKPLISYQFNTQTKEIQGKKTLIDQSNNQIRIILYPRGQRNKKIWNLVKKANSQREKNELYRKIKSDDKFAKEPTVETSGNFKNGYVIDVNGAKIIFNFRKTYYQFLDSIKIRKRVIY